MSFGNFVKKIMRFVRTGKEIKRDEMTQVWADEAFVYLLEASMKRILCVQYQ